MAWLNIKGPTFLNGETHWNGRFDSRTFQANENTPVGEHCSKVPGDLPGRGNLFWGGRTCHRQSTARRVGPGRIDPQPGGGREQSYAAELPMVIELCCHRQSNR